MSTLKLPYGIKDAIPVLDQGFVKLIDFMPSKSSHQMLEDMMEVNEHIDVAAAPGDLAVVQAARVSYKGVSKGDEADRKLINFLVKHGHTSPLEMVEFKFLVKAPVVVWWQWVRHRMAEYNFVSGRYTAYPENDMYVPSRLRGQSKTNKQASDGGINYPELEKELMKRLLAHYEAGLDLYQDMLNAGVAREIARLSLPGFAMYHSAYVKLNGHSLLNFIAKRTDPGAQYEIRVYADAIARVFQEKMPWTYEAFRKKAAKMNFAAKLPDDLTDAELEALHDLLANPDTLRSLLTD